jgi:hypothetical protein
MRNYTAANIFCNFFLDDHWSNNGNAKAIQERVENMLSAEQAALLSQEQAQMQQMQHAESIRKWHLNRGQRLFSKSSKSSTLW